MASVDIFANVGIILFLVSVYFVLTIVVSASRKAIEKCNHIWLTYKDAGQDGISIIDEYKSLREYGRCLRAILPNTIVIFLCYFYMTRIPWWFFELNSGQNFILEVDNSWLLRNAVVWSVRLLFIFACIIPMLKVDYHAFEFPLYYLKNGAELFSLRNSRVSRGIVFFTILINLIALFFVAISYDVMVSRWG